MISREVRGELDKTFEWWESRFHKLIAESGAPVLDDPYATFVEYRTFVSATPVVVKTSPDRYEGCVCRVCSTRPGN